MPSNLIIVESPSKAKTIQKYVGNDYIVESCYGHVRDLPVNKKGVDIEANFKPTYEVYKDKLHIIKKLEKLVKKAKQVYLASDDDREGESIAWHLKEALNIDEEKLNRIVFKEITKQSIISSLNNPRKIDIDLVNSQQARRILDRIVGYDISPILWKKMKPGLSAGRVQSVAVKMIVEKEREINSFVSQDSFKVSSNFFVNENNDDKVDIQASLAKNFDDYNVSYSFLESCKLASFKVIDIEKKDSYRSPSAPYITSTLQQDANYKLGYSVTKTMLLAQRLYEEGNISYMRTDSVRLSQEAIQAAKKQITKLYGKNFFYERQYKPSKLANIQDAHEAIRPTDFSKLTVTDDPSQQKLYELIWKRGIACQMADAKLEKTTVKIGISTRPEILIAKGEIIKFPGFMQVYGKLDDETNILPNLNIDDTLTLNSIVCKQVFTKPPSQYTEASLVKQLEEKGIGRPSTYAPTISTIQNRGYVIKGSHEGKQVESIQLKLQGSLITETKNKEIIGHESNKLLPTNIAMLVNDFLTESFSNITDYEFTANLEKRLDDIAYKSESWVTVLKNFHDDFYPKVEHLTNEKTKYINKVRHLGVDTTSNKPVIARMGRFGPLVQIGEDSTEEKPKFSPLKKGQLIETITLQEALELFKLPRTVGQFEQENIIANTGRFGPYLSHKGAFYSLGKNYDPFIIGEYDAIKVIQDKRESDTKKIIKQLDNGNLTILQGRWGPYIKHPGGNVKLQKDIDPLSLTLEKCNELIYDNAPKSKPSTKSSTKKVKTSYKKTKKT